MVSSLSSFWIDWVIPLLVSPKFTDEAAFRWKTAWPRSWCWLFSRVQQTGFFREDCSQGSKKPWVETVRPLFKITSAACYSSRQLTRPGLIPEMKKQTPPLEEGRTDHVVKEYRCRECYSLGPLLYYSSTWSLKGGKFDWHWEVQKGIMEKRQENQIKMK